MKVSGKKQARKSSTRPASRTGGPTTRKWSAEVTAHSDAMDLRKGVFRSNDPKKIARSVKRSAERSHRRKASPYRSAVSMISFYENRAGTNLPAAKKQTLQRAKAELKKEFHRDQA